MKIVINILLWIWQLPQNILGLFSLLILFFFRKINKIIYEKNIFFIFIKNIFCKKTLSGISLGNFVIIEGINNNAETINHEYGHCQQSKIFGLLYIIVIGLPSIIGNIISRTIKINYYNLPWEHWADKLGKVKRKL